MCCLFNIIMIDIKYIIENKKEMKNSCKFREIDCDIDNIIKIYEDLKKLKIDSDELRRNRNILSSEVNNLKKQGKDAKKIIIKSKTNAKKIKEAELKYKKQYEKYINLMYFVPNPLHKNVPITKEDRVDYESKLKKPNFEFNPKTNWELFEELNLADFKRGIKAAGDRGWVLKGDAARLSRAITNFGLDFFREKGYFDLIPPYFVNEENLFTTGHYPGGEKEVYKTEDGKVFVGTGEISVLAILSGDELNKKDLPKKFMCYTPCFRREAGTHADDKGLYRTHQFDKVELTLITTKENEEKEFNKIFEDLKKFYETLNLPHRIITHRANDMPNKATIEKDIELWLAGEKRWGEAGSVGMTSSFQARRGNIKYIGDGKREFAHTIYATGCVANRILIAILNNNQQKDNSIKIPSVLIPYMNGKKIIKKN
jgi:seryl-tRNA synthetase